jgi:enoyl-CoA hydratase/carnithine racemase
MLDLSRQGDVFVLRMTAGENRFNPTSIAALTSALDEVEAAAGPVALVTTGEGKFYSNGLDLDWLLGPGAAEFPAFVDTVHRFLGRLLAFPVPTVAALNGHTFAAGAMMALAHDVRVQRADRGFFCLPEVDIRIPFTEAMAALIQAKLPQPAVHDAMALGRRYGGHEALAAGIVSTAAAEDELLPIAVAAAQDLAAKDRTTLQAIKRTMYASALALLE